MRNVIVCLCCTLVASAAALGAGGQSVAVFNFQMKSDTPEWLWLEKGLADRITTDFVRDRSVTVIARDRMQVAAQKVGWTAEMSAKDERQLKQVREQLQIAQVVSGVYEVSGQAGSEQVKLIAQVVDVQGRKELFRKELSGPAADVLELQRKLSAELMGYFSGKPADKILPELPIWTRSLPAAKALYEGMDLYDQGRYAEGWYKFRQASAADPRYLEAQYWVGKMYYFMDRYEHARRVLEKVIYLDSGHPRMADAMTEYLHTYERSSVSNDALLAIYDSFRRKYPDVMRTGYTQEGGPQDADMWLRQKSADLLNYLGRHDAAAALCRPSLSYNMIRRPLALLSAEALYARTAQVLGAEALVDQLQYWVNSSSIIYVRKDGAPIDSPLNDLPQPTRILGKNRAGDDRAAAFASSGAGRDFVLVAPPGYIFKSLRFHPLMDGQDAVLEVGIGPAASKVLLAGQAKTLPVQEAMAKGLVWDRLPPGGYLRVHWQIRVRNDDSPSQAVRGIRIVPELEKIERPGTIDVTCQSTSAIVVAVDGALARACPGLVGPLAAGEHLVVVNPLEPDGPFDVWRGKVQVRPGQTEALSVALPWKKDSPWASWSNRLLSRGGIARGPMLCSEAPSLVVDAQAIRVVWSDGQDLWACVSTDGMAYSAPARLDLPVSSAWREFSPRVIRDEAGRFVLVFLSDRDARHVVRAYVCWSRDFVHWSSPSAVGQGFDWFGPDFIQDQRGRYVLAVSSPMKAKLIVSRNLIDWQDGAHFSADPWTTLSDVRLRQASDGQYHLAMISRPYSGPRQCVVRHFHSGDLEHWSPPVAAALAGLGDDAWPASVSLIEKDGQLQLATASFGMQAAAGQNQQATVSFERAPPATQLRMASWDGRGTWIESAPAKGLLPGRASMAYDPKWGYLFAWSLGGGPSDALPHLAHSGDGPFVLRGSALPDLLKPSLAVRTPATVPVALPNTPTTLPSGTPVGQLVYQAQSARPQAPGPLKRPRDSSVVVSEPKSFVPVPAGCGTKHPEALVVALKQQNMNIKLALDSNDPKAQHFDVIRVDLTGKGQFADAPMLKRTNLLRDQFDGAYFYEFAGDLEVPIGNRKASVNVYCSYRRHPTNPSLQWSLGMIALGDCLFDGKIHRVALIDCSSNGRLDDPPVPAMASNYADRVIGFKAGDYILVDVGDGSFSRCLQGFPQCPIYVEGRPYRVHPTADGEGVVAEAFATEMGKLKIAKPSWKATLVGKKYCMIVSGGKDPVPLPADTYAATEFQEWFTETADDGGGYVRTQYEPERIVVAAGQTTEVRHVGLPVAGKVVHDIFNTQHRFFIQWSDPSGRQILNVQPPGPMVMELIDAQGTIVRTVKSDMTVVLWKPPEEIKGTYKVRLSPGLEGCKVEPGEITFK